MKKRLYVPNTLPPLKTVSNGYEYYSNTSAYGMVYLRKKLGEGHDAPEVIYLYIIYFEERKREVLNFTLASIIKFWIFEINEHVNP